MRKAKTLEASILIFMEGHIALIFVVSSRWVNHIVRISDYASRWVYLQLWVRHACGCNLRWASMQACSRVPTLWIKILLPYLSAHSSSLSLSIQVFASKRNRSSRHAKVGFETLGMSTDTTFHYVLRRLYLDKNRKSSLVSNT